MRFGLCTISNKDAGGPTVIEQAATAGYDGVEIWGRDHVGDGTPEECRTLRRAADEHGIEIPVYGSYLRPGTAEFPEGIIPELTIADHLDADLIRVWAGTEEFGDHDHDHWTTVAEDLQTLSACAEKHEIEVTVEKHEGSLTNTQTGARRLLEAVDHSNCGLNYQPLFSIPNSDLLDEIRVLGPYCNNVHLQAVPERGGWPRCALEHAYFDVVELLGQLSDTGFDGYVNVEFVRDDIPYERAIADDLGYLRSVTDCSDSHQHNS